MTETQHASASVQASVTFLANYLALLTKNNPLGTVTTLLARPDVQAIIASTLAGGAESAQETVRQAWAAQDGPPGSPVFSALLSDVQHAWDTQRLRQLIKQAWASVPKASFVPGTTSPGTHPSLEAATQRAAAVRDAVTGFGDRARLRNGLSADVAAGNAKTEAVLADAKEREAAGEKLLKRWRAHVESPACCHWCKKLNGVTIGLDEDFAPHIGPPVDLTGHGHLTQPPHPYLSYLPGPKLHPHCQCWLEIVVVTEAQPESVSPAGGQEPPLEPGIKSPAPQAPAGHLAASEVRAMPEDKYRSLLSFLRAAVHELGQLVRRLARRG